MVGVFINCGLIVIGSLIGLLFKKFVKEELGDFLMKGMALCVIFVGIQGSLTLDSVIGNALGEEFVTKPNSLVLIVSMAIGGIVGHLLNLDGKINSLGDKIQNFAQKRGSNSPVSQAFVTATLLYCVGAMAIVGSIQAGTVGDNSVLVAKGMIDAVTAVVFASQLGFGVALSAVPVFLYQGVIALCASLLKMLPDTIFNLVIAEMSCIGYVLIIGIGLNMLGLTKLKLMNYVPGVIIAGLIPCVAQFIPAIYNFLYA